MYFKLYPLYITPSLASFVFYTNIFVPHKELHYKPAITALYTPTPEQS